MEWSEEDRIYIEENKENFPPPCDTPEGFERHVRSQTQFHASLCTTVQTTVADKVLAPLKKQFRHRFLCRIDDSQQSKTPASVLDKIRRSQTKPESERYTIGNFGSKMTDLARFRVVCNFLSDVGKVAKAMEECEELRRIFNIASESSLEVRPRQRKSGERSMKLILEHKTLSGLFLEIQVMTQLQESWDKKDHFLVYEPRRKAPDGDDDNFPDFLDARMFAMAELLSIADIYFDDLRRSREEGGNSVEKRV